jgi:hypothetical protein
VRDFSGLTSSAWALAKAEASAAIQWTGAWTASVSSKSKAAPPGVEQATTQMLLMQNSRPSGAERRSLRPWAAGSAGSAGDEFAPARSAHVKVLSMGNGSDTNLRI